MRTNDDDRVGGGRRWPTGTLAAAAAAAAAAATAAGTGAGATTTRATATSGLTSTAAAGAAAGNGGPLAGASGSRFTWRRVRRDQSVNGGEPSLRHTQHAAALPAAWPTRSWVRAAPWSTCHATPVTALSVGSPTAACVSISIRGRQCARLHMCIDGSERARNSGIVGALLLQGIVGVRPDRLQQKQLAQRLLVPRRQHPARRRPQISRSLAHVGPHSAVCMTGASTHLRCSSSH
jgi:hypothetical protein